MQSKEKVFVGIDFSKEKFDACVLLYDGGVMGNAVFENNKKGYARLLAWVRKTSELGRDYKLDEVLFCGENTGMLSLGLSEFLFVKGGRMWLENAYTIKLGSGLRRDKSDKADAETIAYYAYRFHDCARNVEFKPESLDMKKLRSLYEFRDRTMRERVALGNQINSQAFDFSPEVRRRSQKRHKALCEEETVLEHEIESHMKDSAEFSDNYRLLVSFPGIGLLTAVLLIIHTSNFQRFTDARKFSCYGGMAPFGKQSGTSIHTRPHVSHLGHKKVKAALVQTARISMIHNSIIRDYALHLREMGKPEGVIINNVKNKILHIVFKMIESKTLWNRNYQSLHHGGSDK